MKSKMTIGKKLLLATGAFVALTMTFGYWSIASIFDAAVSKTARKLEYGGQIDTIKSDMYVSQRGSVRATFMKDAARTASLRKEFEGHAQEMSARSTRCVP